MLGAITGDIVGSVYEFHNYRAKDFQPLFHPQARFTDDTVCTVAIADALLHQLDPAITLQGWCRRYWSNGGWGQRFAFWIARDTPAPYGSYGNGAAMRVSAAGFLAESLDAALDAALRVTAITHDHPEGIKGAQATAAALWWARQGWGPEAIRQAVTDRFGYDLSRTPDEIRPHYRHTESCQGSVPPAIVCALAATDFEDAIRTAVSIGGDSDTIAAIAGSIAEARFGIPEAMVKQTWSYLPNDMRMVLIAVYAKRGETLPKGTLGLTFTSPFKVS